MARRYVALPEPPVLGHDCSTCALSSVVDDGGHGRLECGYPSILVSGSAVALWRGCVAELDAMGWPAPTVKIAAQCPGWMPAWGEEAA